MTIQRWACVEARTTCGRCGSPVPLSGPNRTPLCHACQSPISIAPATWKSLLEDIEEDWAEIAEGEGQSSKIFTGGAEFSRDWFPMAPRCAKCKGALPIESIAPGSDTKMFCPGCGAPTQSYAAPDWLRAVLPNAVQIVGGDREDGGPAAGQAPEIDRDAPQPIVMTCPQCGGALRITVDEKRVTPCTFCKTDVYLPDDVWKRMHPVKTVAPWWIGLAGAGKTKEAEEADGDHDSDHDPGHEEAPAAETHGSGIGGTIFVVGLVAVLGGIGWFGFAVLPGLLRGNPSTASGQFQATGPRLGTWVLQPTGCTSAAPMGLSGVVLAGTDPHTVTVTRGPTGLAVAAGTAGDPTTHVSFAGCAAAQGEIHAIVSPSNGSQGFAGSVTVQCTTGGETLVGTATFDGCY